MAKNAVLPGMDFDVPKAVLAAAERLDGIRAQRMALTKEEKEAADDLISEMKANKLKRFRNGDACPPYTVELVPADATPKVKIKHDRDEFDDDEEVVSDREARKDEPLGKNTMAKRSGANRPLETGREKMAKSRASGDPAKAKREAEAVSPDPAG